MSVGDNAYMQKIIVTFVFVVVMYLVLSFLSQKSLPTSTLYNIKRLNENINLLSRTTPNDKAKYYSELLDIRLRELKTLTSRKKEHHLILPAALRYSTIAGEYTQLIKNNNLTDQASSARRQFSEHTKILKQLITTYPRMNVGDRGDQFIVDDVNYLIIYEKELPR